MKKTIRLTESDLIKIINRVISEQGDTMSASKEYAINRAPVSNTAYTDIPQEKFSEFVNFHPGGSYVDVQNHLMRTYGMPRLFSDEQLKKSDPRNVELNQFKQLLYVIQASLMVAAEKNISGNLFANADISKLNNVIGDRMATKDWANVLKDIPFIGDSTNKKTLQKFIAKIIDARRAAVGVKNNTNPTTTGVKKG